MTNKICLLDLCKYYKALPHQMAGIAELEEAINKANPHILGREQGWFKTWSQGGLQQDYTPALKLIKEFEGRHLSAYPDPLHGWDVATIGYGTTRYQDGRKVKQGDKITVIEADRLLLEEVERIAAKLGKDVPSWQEMADEQQSALISFAYNLGADFYNAAGFETISRELREKDWASVPDALMLYRNPGTNVEAGLKRRRIAEGKLWREGLPSVKVTPSSPFGTSLTANFTLGEFALGQPARRFTEQHQVDTAIELAKFLERVRSAFGGKRVTITSGYRPAAINRQVGGASASEHLYNAADVGAVDFYIDGADINKVQAWCDKEWPYSLGYGAPKGFVHLGIRQGRPRVRWDY